MLNNNISNQSGVTIAFRCEDFLIKYKDTTVKDKIFNTIMKKRRVEVNEKVRLVMEHIYRNTEYNVDLVVEERNYTDHLKTVLEEIPYSRVVKISNLNQIASRLLVGDISYYVDDDYQRRSLVGSKYAVSLEDIRKLTRVGR